MVRRKRSMKINRLIYFRIGLRGRTPADELKGNCASYAEKEDETGPSVGMYTSSYGDR